MRYLIALLLLVVGCRAPAPRPVASPSAPVERYWNALRDRDVALFKTAFSAQEAREMERDGWAVALDETIAFPLALADSAGLELEPGERAKIARWNEQIPVEKFSYDFRGGSDQGEILAFLPEAEADRVPHPTVPTENGKVLVWRARVVREGGEWLLDEQ